MFAIMAVGIRYRVFASPDPACGQVPERNLVHHFRGHQIAAQQAGDRLSVFFGDGRGEVQGILTSYIPLPAETYDREAVAQQPFVSSARGERRVSAIDEGEDVVIAAVGNLQDHRTVAFARILRTNGDELRNKLDLAVPQVLSVADVDDPLIMGIGYRD